ncbi:MAG: DNA mismatch repair protein MutS [Eubacterium sp.]|nr:DNA mismatch repair protein MutS [Eubacterium sp.]
MNLSYEQKEQMGFQYIMDRLTPSSPYGQECLRHLVPYTKEQERQLKEDLDNIETLLAHEKKLRTQIGQLRRLFMQMKEIRPAIKKGREICLSDVELFEIKNFLLYSEKARKVERDIAAQTSLRGMEYRVTTPALELLDPDGRRIPSFSVSSLYSETLREIRNRKKDLEKQMEIERDNQDRWNALKERRNRVVVEEEKEEQVIREKLTRQLIPYFDDILANVETTGKLDVLLEKMHAAMITDSSKPQITTDVLCMHKAKNPWVMASLKEKGLKFTPLSIELMDGAGVITGANMGGKSVTLQTITLNVLLAMCGFYVYCETAQVPLFDEILIISEEGQSVSKGLSSFGAQIVQLKQMVQFVENEYCFVVMDEFARGTNPEEGAALVRAVAKYLNTKNVIGLMVTHFDHVAEHARVHYQVAGLKDMDMMQVEHEIMSAGEKNGVEVIASHMNYGIFKVESKTDCPRDAFRICRLLGLQGEIMDYLTE